MLQRCFGDTEKADSVLWGVVTMWLHAPGDNIGSHQLTNRADLGRHQLLWRCLRAGVRVIETTFISGPGMESSVTQSDDSQNRSQREMDTRLFDGPQHLPFSLFGDENPRENVPNESEQSASL